jgi:hypothetical protein
MSRASLILVALLLAPAGCRQRSPRSPEQLRQRYAEALRQDDPQMAYALLAPEVQARVSPEEFARRWREEAKEHAHALEQIDGLDEAHAAAVQQGTTVHAGGRVLHWAKVGDHYFIVGGLPQLPDTSTPAQTIRSFLAAVRSADFTAFETLLATELLGKISEDWEARAAAIEKALEQPGAIEISADLARAELRYDAERAITLEQTEFGWRITALE